jgi:hypothetical protein
MVISRRSHLRAGSRVGRSYSEGGSAAEFGSGKSGVASRSVWHHLRMAKHGRWCGTATTALAMAGFLSSACSKPTSSTASVDGGGSVPAAPATLSAKYDCKSLSACAALPAADINRSIGTKYGPGSDTKSPTLTLCRYNGQEPEVKITLICSTHDLTAVGRGEMKQVYAGQGYACSPVAGVGDEAQWCKPSPGGGKEGFGDSLDFFTGNVFGILEFQSKSDNTHGRVPTSDYRAAAEQLAKTMIGRL